MPAIPLIKEADTAHAEDAAQKVVEVHRRLVAFLEPGQTLAQIDSHVRTTLDDLKCKSCFFAYRPGGMPPFPSQACLSLNDCIVHGTATYTDKPLAKGDLLKIDIGVDYKGWIGDAAWTYSIGEPSPECRRLMDAGKDSLAAGVEILRAGNRYNAWAVAVQDLVERDRGLHLVRGLGGHGYGKKLHAPPFISNTRESFPGEWPDGNRLMEHGTLLAVEPMIATGTNKTKQAPRSWPIFTADGSMAVHHEHDVLITDNGPKILTEGLQHIPDVINT